MTDAHDHLAGRRTARAVGVCLAVAVVLVAITIAAASAPSLRAGGILMGGAVLSTLIFWLSLRHADLTAGDLAQSLAAAQAFDLAPATVGYRAATGLTEAEAARHEREFRRWAVLAALAPRRETILPVWSSPLIDYRNTFASAHPALFQALCAALPGGSAPLVLLGGFDAEAQRRYAALNLAYDFAFGEAPDPAVWPAATDAEWAWHQAQLAAAHPNEPLGAAVAALAMTAVTEPGG